MLFAHSGGGSLASAGWFLLFGPIINAPLDIDDVIDSAELSSVEWIATDVVIDYDITCDVSGSFAMHASEKNSAQLQIDFLSVSLTDPKFGVDRDVTTVAQ